VRLDEACSHIVDCEHRTAPIDESGDYFAVGTPAMRCNQINYAEARRISRATFEAWTRRLAPAAGDLLLAREAPVGPIVRLPAEANVAPGQRTVLLRPDPDVCDSRYLYFALSSPMSQMALQTKAAGSTVHHLNVPDIRAFELPIPPLAEQQAIAEVLGALDDKIAANTALAICSDRMAEVEFTNHLVGAGTEERLLAEVATVVLGGTPSRARPEYWTSGTVPWLNSGAVNEHRILEPSALITEEALTKSAAKLMPVGATLLAITGATLGQIARLEIQAAGNQSIVGVWSERTELNTWLYFAIRRRIDNLLARATGAAQQHVSKGDVGHLLVPVPSTDVVARFSSIALPLLDMAANVERENRTLAKTRDALLPPLMSGRLRVRDAERIAVDAGL